VFDEGGALYALSGVRLQSDSAKLLGSLECLVDLLILTMDCFAYHTEV